MTTIPDTSTLQTDGRTDNLPWQYRTLRIASRGKKIRAISFVIGDRSDLGQAIPLITQKHEQSLNMDNHRHLGLPCAWNVT